MPDVQNREAAFNSHDLTALHGLSDHFADVGALHLTAAGSVQDASLANRFRAEGERYRSIAKLLRQAATPGDESDEEPGSSFQLIDKLRLALDDLFEAGDEAEETAAREGKIRLASIIESYQRSPEFSDRMREILQQVRSCVGAQVPPEAPVDLKELARD